MKLFELLESVERVNIGSVTVTVYKNPSFQQIEYLINYMIKHNRQEFPHLRGYVDPETNDYYVWDANYAIHFEVARELGITYTWKNRCDIVVTTQSEVRFDYTEDFLLKTPNVARINRSLPNFKFTSELPILENTIRTTDETGETFVVTHNPTRQQFQKMISNPEADMKAWLGPKDIWIWPAWHAHHHQIANNFGLSPQDDNLHTIFIRSNGILVMTYDKKPFKNHPILNRLYGPNYTVG